MALSRTNRPAAALPTGARPQARPRTKEHWSSLVRTLALVTLIPAVRIGLIPVADTEINGVVLLLGAYVILGLFGPRWLPVLRRADVLVVLDVAVITLVVTISNGLGSPFLYLYYLVILEAAVRLNVRQALAASGAIAGMVVLLWVRAGPGGVLENPVFKLGLFNGGGFFLAMFLGTLVQEHRFAEDVASAYETTLEGWSRALDLRDQETEGHAERVAEMAVRLARALGVPASALVHIRQGALLHDIGKMAIPDSILLKPGPLTDEEWEIMRRHPGYAYELLSPIPYLRPALEIPYCHHERWDGTGYPRGLRGEEIPLAARIFAVVDVWDALRSDRPYRPAWPEDRVREHLRAEAGRQFDPRVAEAFLGMLGAGARAVPQAARPADQEGTPAPGSPRRAARSQDPVLREDLANACAASQDLAHGVLARDLLERQPDHIILDGPRNDETSVVVGNDQVAIVHEDSPQLDGHPNGRDIAASARVRWGETDRKDGELHGDDAP